MAPKPRCCLVRAIAAKGRLRRFGHVAPMTVFGATLSLKRVPAKVS